MYKDERIVGIIPARGGSKSVPRKNIRLLGGIPLIGWSINAARSSQYVDQIIVSTDDDEIATIAATMGVDACMRPPELATDTALVKDAIRHVRDRIRSESDVADLFLLLEPTCPFRQGEDIDACIVQLVEENLDAVASFVEAKLHPYRAWSLAEGTVKPFTDDTDPWQPRQSLPPAYQLNGAVYCFRDSVIDDPGPSLLSGDIGYYVMPPERSVDIDSLVDFAVAEAMLATANDET